MAKINGQANKQAEGEAIAIPVQGIRFQFPGGKIVPMGLVQADQLRCEVQEASQGKPHYWHLEQFASQIAEATGTHLNLDEADAFWNYVMLERARARKDFFDSLKSLSSTESMPAE